MADAPNSKRLSITHVLARAVLLLAAVCVVGFAVWSFREELNIEALAEREARFRAAFDRQPVMTWLIAFGCYVAVAGLSLPGAAAVSVVYGWLFGFWPALLLVSFASTAGATLSFLSSRYLVGNLVQAHFGDRLERFNAAIEREGAFYLLTLRLLPQAPFFIVNLVMGLTKIRVRTFWWVSQIGMLPGTCIFVLAGASAPSLNTVAERGLASILNWKLLMAMTLLGIMPLALKKVIVWLKPQAHQSARG